MNESLVSYAKKVQSLGFQPVPILGTEKKPPGWFPWTDLRDGKRSALTNEEIEKVFANPEVDRVGIILNKRSFLIDYDGTSGQCILWSEVIPRCSKELQRLLRSTAHTKTPHGGHILVTLDDSAFPDGVEEILCWQVLNNGHTNCNEEIRVLSQKKYSIEYGQGYEPTRKIEDKVTLSKEASTELVEIFRRFKSESVTIRNIASSISPYWIKERRQDVALAISGYLYKNKVDEYMARCLVQYLVQFTDDEEAAKRLDAVKITYSKKVEEVSGYSRLLELIDGNESTIQKIHQQCSSLGYHFNGNGYGRKGEKSPHSSTSSWADDVDSSATIAIGLINEYITDLFVDKFDTPFVTITINGHIETLPVKGNKFKKWVCKLFYEFEGRAINGQALASTCNVIEAKALFSDKIKELNLRVSDGHVDINEDESPLANYQQHSMQQQQVDTYYYDLTNKKRQVVKITSEGWTIEDPANVPTVFYRRQGQLPQATPSRDYPVDIFDQFMDLINTSVKDNEGKVLEKETRVLRLLLKCYIIALFIPNIGRVILLLHGEKGSAKTALMELVKLLVDPSSALTLTFPSNIAELAQQLYHNFIAYYDNVSVIKSFLSDALCRAATGTGFSKRELYTDDDDIIYEFIRSVGVSAIHLPGTKPDLLDRSLIVKLSFIDKKIRRKYKEDILPRFEQIRPKLLGYIFDILVRVLQIKAEGGIELETRSRMADWEEHAEIIARCMGYKPLEFINAYNANTDLQTDLILEDRPVARAIIKLSESFADGEFWSGSTTELLHRLQVIAMDLKIDIHKDNSWPKAANSLSFRLNEIKPNLREIGIQILETKNSRSRLKTLHVCKTPSASSASSASYDGSASNGNEHEPSDAVDDVDNRRPSDNGPSSSDEYSQNHVEDGYANDADNANDLLHTKYNERRKNTETKTKETELGTSLKTTEAEAMTEADKSNNENGGVMQ